MPNTFVELSIQIQAPAKTVWRIFIDPSVTHRLGGEYISTWEVGSSIAWRGLDAKIYTRGNILQIEEAKLLQHNLLFPLMPEEGKPSIVHSTLTYRLEEENGVTTLFAREEFPQALSDKNYADAEQGWAASLKTLKQLAEQAK